MLISWAHRVSGDYATSANWSPAVVPGPSDDVSISVNGTYTVTSSVDETVNSLSILDKHATLLIEGTSLTALTNFTTQTGGVNDGTIALNDSNFVGGAGTFTNNHLISGSGEIGGTSGGFPGTPPSFTLINEAGAIINGDGLTIARANVENAGILEANGGFLLIAADNAVGNVPITVHNTPQGIIEANGANTNIDLFGPVTIVGGTLETRGTNAVINIDIDGVMLDGSQPGNPLNIDGNVLIGNTTTVFVTGTINNTGEITAASGLSSLNSALISIQGDATLEGGGQITLTKTNGPPVSAIFGGVLTNVDNVISGTGLIGDVTTFSPPPPNGILINEAKGIVDANASTPLILTASGTDINTGLMEATLSGTLLIENVTIDNFLNHTNGTIEAGQGSVVGLQNATIIGGNIHVNGQLLVTGDVSLQGNGDLDLSGGVISGLGTLSTDSTIFGSGTIGNVGGPVLTNEVTGVIDANDPNAPLTIDATPVKNTSLTNAGLLEATHGGTLVLSGIISNTTTGTLEAHHGSTIALEGGNIFGGTVTVLHGATIEAEQAAGTIFAAAVTNAGTIGAEGANLTINGDVTNAKGTLDADNATLEIDGAVNGGRATIEGTGEIGFGGPSSADVRFEPSSDAILKLVSPSTFTGTVFGLPTGAYLDLTNINFANDPTINYSSRTHLLTVTDSVSGVTDTITLKHVSGSFSAQSDGNGGTLIADTSPPNPVAVCHDQDSFVFAPHLRDNPVSNVNVHDDALDLPHSQFAELATLMNHHDGALDLSAHDANDHAAAVMAQHTHHFLV